MDQVIYDSFINVLEKELVPALGCTEPIAVAYAAAKGREVLGAFPEKLKMCIRDRGPEEDRRFYPYDQGRASQERDDAYQPPVQAGDGSRLK